MKASGMRKAPPLPSALPLSKYRFLRLGFSVVPVLLATETD